MFTDHIYAIWSGLAQVLGHIGDRIINENLCSPHSQVLLLYYSEVWGVAILNSKCVYNHVGLTNKSQRSIPGPYGEHKLLSFMKVK